MMVIGDRKVDAETVCLTSILLVKYLTGDVELLGRNIGVPRAVTMSSDCSPRLAALTFCFVQGI
jgi:hypothetical protein